MEQFLNKDEFIFRKYQNSELIGDMPETIKYLKSWFKENPDGKIAIGTDSQRFKNTLVYVTVVSLFYPTVIDIKNGIPEILYCKGAHLIYFKQRLKLKKIDLWTRLWHEVELTRIVSEEISKSISNNIEVHLDLNPDAEYASNKLFQAAVGYLRSFNFNVITKPDGWVASCAADSLTR